MSRRDRKQYRIGWNRFRDFNPMKLLSIWSWSEFAEGESASAARRHAGRVGRRAEWLAAALLLCKGYRVLARGFTVAGGEIDIVALRGDTVAFVEVKARADIATALAAIDAGKRRRVARAAAVWLSRNAWAAGSTFRGDAVLIAPRRWPRHVADAFRVPIA